MYKIKDESEVQLFILYVLNGVKRPLDEASINDIMLQDELIDQFQFTEAFCFQLERGNIEEVRNAESDTPLYVISEQGSTIAENLAPEKLNGYVRERSKKSAMRFLSLRDKNAKVSFTFDSLPNDRYVVHCTVSEDGIETVSVSLVVDSRNQLEKVKHYFCDHPETIYRGAYTLLTGEMDYLING